MTATGEWREPVKVFISYAHESTEHADLVRDLWVLLRRHGVDAELDLAAAERRQDWPRWMIAKVREADFVLVIVSEAYKRRSEGLAAADEGRGVQFEAALICEEFYRDRIAATERFLPVLLPGALIEHIPAFMGPTSGTSYPVEEISFAGIETVLRVLTAQPWEVQPPLGPIPVLPARTTSVPSVGGRVDRARELAHQVDTTFARWERVVARELLDPVIHREDTAMIARLLRGDSVRTVLVSGGAGIGKSGVLHQLAAALACEDWPILALRLDRLESFGRGYFRTSARSPCGIGVAGRLGCGVPSSR